MTRGFPLQPTTPADRPSNAAVSNPPGPNSAVGRYRWRICALLFFATTINYLDRQVLGVLAPLLQTNIGWSEIQYGYIVASFQIAYAVGLVAMGGLIDRIGTRVGYTLMIAVWSLAAMAHAAVASVAGFIAVRFLLGIGESGNFPAAVKTVAEWFPRRERSFATGIFNSGSNVGAILAPLTVPFIAVAWGWQWAFLITGAIGSLWLLIWWRYYRPPAEHPSLSEAELAYINSDPDEPVQHIPWARLLPHRQTWSFLAAKFFTDPIWWIFLSWLPKFLNETYGLSITELGPPLVVIYVMADAGSIGGGWLASLFLKRGWTVNRARKSAMGVCAVAVIPIIFAAQASNLWTAVLLVGLATAAHQGWSANAFTMVSDMFPRSAVASVVGIGGFGGAIGSAMASTMTGFLLETTGSYVPVFLIAGTAYLIALGVVHLLTPEMRPVESI